MVRARMPTSSGVNSKFASVNCAMGVRVSCMETHRSKKAGKVNGVTTSLCRNAKVPRPSWMAHAQIYGMVEAPLSSWVKQ